MESDTGEASLRRAAASADDRCVTDAPDREDLDAVGELWRLTRRNDPRAARRAVEALQSPHPWVRGEAVRCLRKIGDPATAPALRDALTDPAGDVARVAAQTLGSLGDRESIEPLISTLQVEDWTVRRSAAIALGQLPQRAAVPHLAVALADPTPAVQRASAWALARIEAPDSIDALRAASPSGLRTKRAVGRALRRLERTSANS